MSDIKTFYLFDRIQYLSIELQTFTPLNTFMFTLHVAFYTVSKMNNIKILSSKWDALCSVGGKTQGLGFILKKLRLRMVQALQKGLSEMKQSRKTGKKRIDKG